MLKLREVMLELEGGYYVGVRATRRACAHVGRTIQPKGFGIVSLHQEGIGERW